MRLSVIVPTLDEEGQLEAVLRSARASGAIELIVVDGGSGDRTVEVAATVADRVIRAPRGRASQMNAGAGAATGDVLLFLHADTRLPPDFAGAIESALSEPEVVGGRFDVRLEPTTPLLGLVAFLMNRRSRLTGIATGDQAIFVRGAVFERLGGYGDLPLMEDIDFTRRLKRAGRIAALHARVSTSSRRWLEAGPLRTILLMWSLRLLYFAGVSPARLRRFYADRR
jgi:rSAM/selenodomain-associated transferase 2